MALSDGQFLALSNLARKQAGEDVDWINISDARALTELGLAERNREGWKITEEGAALLAERRSGAVVLAEHGSEAEILPLIPLG